MNQVDVHVNTADLDSMPDDKPESEYFINKRTIMADKVFAGVEPLPTGGYNKKTVGNTVIVQHSDNGVSKMIHFCNAKKCVEFVMPDGDVITKYYSIIGPNDVPYPIAVGKKYVYFMAEYLYYPVNIFVCKTPHDWANLAPTLYGQENEAYQPIIKKNTYKLKFKVVKF
jgi:hypothetical protein